MLGQVDFSRLRAYRLGRVQAQLRERGCGAALLSNPINIRYALGSRQAAVFNLYSPAIHVVVPSEGKAVVFHQGDPHVYEGLDTVGDLKPACNWYFFEAGPRYQEKAVRWAGEIMTVLRHLGASGLPLAVDRLDPIPAAALQAKGASLVNGQELLEYARSVKSSDELACMRHVLSICEGGMHRMRKALEPGITEDELWSILCEANIRAGGEWIETRLLASGPRTNPWLQSASSRVIRYGELVGFDTDMVGPNGYLADISRTFICGSVKPSGEQKRLFQLAYEQLQHNIDLLRPGLSFCEFSKRAWPLPEEFFANRYICLIHGAGMGDEYPLVPNIADFPAHGYDGELRPNMVVCVESYIGSAGGKEGVKLEEQVLIAEGGHEVLSSFPFEESLLS
jgi:Xaa-Pro aminopeptidase